MKLHLLLYLIPKVLLRYNTVSEKPRGNPVMKPEGARDARVTEPIGECRVNIRADIWYLRGNPLDVLAKCLGPQLFLHYSIEIGTKFTVHCVSITFCAVTRPSVRPNSVVKELAGIRRRPDRRRRQHPTMSW